MGQKVLVRAVVDVEIDAEKLADENRKRVTLGKQAKSEVDEVEERIGEAFGGLCELAQYGAKVSAAVIS